MYATLARIKAMNKTSGTLACLLLAALLTANANGGTLALFENTDALTPANTLDLGSGSGGGIFEFTDNLNGSFIVKG
jgi:hypothetical protein